MRLQRGLEFLGVVTGHELGLVVHGVRETFFGQVPGQDELEGFLDVPEPGSIAIR